MHLQLSSETAYEKLTFLQQQASINKTRPWTSQGFVSQRIDRAIEPNQALLRQPTKSGRSFSSRFLSKRANAEEKLGLRDTAPLQATVPTKHLQLSLETAYEKPIFLLQQVSF
jgi:hypothetical protein